MIKGRKPPNKPKPSAPPISKVAVAPPAGTKSLAATTPTANSAAMAPATVKPGPCKITADPSGQYDFQIRAADMPVSIKLCENHQGDPATTSSFNLVDVQSLATNPPTAINGQPSGITATTFSLTLPVGVYYIGIVVNHLPNSVMAYVCENCVGLTQLTHILTGLQQPSGYFTLRVV